MAQHIPLQGQPNFRDLGGIATADGRKIKSGLVYRSGELCQLSDNDVGILEQLGIKTVIDFRSNKELETRGPDRVPDSATYHHIPIDFGDLTQVIWKGFGEGDFSGIPSTILTDLNKYNFSHSTKQYATLLRAIINSQDSALVFHCTHGKDRAGIGAAILLLALGVTKATVIENYLASNTYRAEANRQLLKELAIAQAEKKGVPLEQVDVSGIQVIYYLKASYFDNAYEWLMKSYASFDDYLTQAVGLSVDELSALRNALLTSN